jgi:hypothetical protein
MLLDLVQELIEVVVDSPGSVSPGEAAVLKNEAYPLIDRGVLLVGVLGTNQLMSGETEKMCSHPAFTGKGQVIRANMIEPGRAGFCGALDYYGIENSLIRCHRPGHPARPA